MKLMKPVYSALLMVMLGGMARGQNMAQVPPVRCGTMENLELLWKDHPQLKQQFEHERSRFNKLVRQRSLQLSGIAPNANRGAIIIPVVFHVVVTDQAQVTDAQLMAQLDTLNKDYAGLNGDTVRVPTWFKPFFGHSPFKFCLARQTPSGDPTSGIERTTTTVSTFLNTSNNVKHASSGGADTWDPSSYLNVWICPLANGLLGYSAFPNAGNENEQGVVIEYRSLPGSSYASYNGGKTLTHEIGHYFNLYHIWGDDNGACTGTDYVDDTPNQADFTSVCYTGIITDSCTPSGNGIMYQNYMDYTPDACLVMFTVQQVARMESAFTAYRSSLLGSVACQPPVSYNLDAQLKSINLPGQRVCSNPFTPVITIRNRGVQTLSSLTITTMLDNTIVASMAWTGSLAQLATATVNLNAITVSPGSHILKIYLSKPNNGIDQNPQNDSAAVSFQYYDAVTAVSESFEGNIFPPPGWDIVNPDKSITWQKVTGIARTGNASVMIDNHHYSAIGQQDYLRLPDISLSGTDSVFFSFQVAAATYTSTTVSNNTWDTLEVLASRDCGQTYTSLYKKYGPTLVTHTAPVAGAFVPAPNEWRKDSVNISNFIGPDKLLLAFRNTTGFENNIYIDDVNLRTITVNPNLKKSGFLATPSPTHGTVIIQFYPQPTNVKSIQLFNMAGQQVAETIPAGQSNYYAFDISRYANGIYIVRVVMGNTVLMKKIVKY